MTFSRTITLGVVAWSSAFLSAPAEAQDDVELWGVPYGTSPPAGYYVRRALQPGAYTYGRAWMARNPGLEVVGQLPDGTPDFQFRDPTRPSQPRAVAPGGRASASVTGTFRVPLVLGYYSDAVVPAYTREEVQSEFFDGPNSNHKTIEEYYAEVSGGAIDFQGESHGWAQSTVTGQQVVGNSMGLGVDAQVGLFVLEILNVLDDGSIDWGVYDNDGPDGLPNSGDDDGYVDILAVFQPSSGAECGGAGQSSRVWSHKWRLGASTGQQFVTSSVAAGGGQIRIDDYAIQPLLDCGSTTDINRIGVLAHELGHGFGLPDLYAVGASHAGIGAWGLMSTGSWGCLGGGQPERPCHMSAWSKEMLGWVNVETLAPDTDHGSMTVGPVQETGTVYRVDAADGSGEYFLLENRQREGFDQSLALPGLLVWHIDPQQIALRRLSNTVNSDANHMGVWLRQADGLNQLAFAGTGRGDSGDPFPGSSGAQVFHSGSSPNAYTHDGNASGLTLLDITLAGTDINAHVLTHRPTVSVSTDGDGGLGSLRVDGSLVPPSGFTFQSTPFQEHRIEVSGGSEIDEGRRLGFLGWTDDPFAPRVRDFVTGLADVQLVAGFGGVEARVRSSISGEAFGADPGTVRFTPQGLVESDGTWFLEGSAVTVEALPTQGFGFSEWTGALGGSGNPASLAVSGPADVGANFELIYDVPEGLSVGLVGGVLAQVDLEALNATPPIVWAREGGLFPEGVALQSNGQLVGVPLETGAFPIDVRATDSRGLSATGTIVIDVSSPVIGTGLLTGPFLLQSQGMTADQRNFLDYEGNRNGTYDLGDLRAFILANPGLPPSQQSTVAPITSLVMFTFPGDRR